MNPINVCISMLMLVIATQCGAAETKQSSMFEVEAIEVVKDAVEVRGCRVEPKDGQVLFISMIRFTKAGTSLSKEEFAKLDVSRTSKEFAEAHGPLIAYGDFRLRLRDKTLVPCSCLPQSGDQPGPKVRVEAAKGEDDWLMYLGAVQLLAAVKPGTQPEALIWGGKFEAAIPSK